MKPRRILVTGSRKWTDQAAVEHAIVRQLTENPSAVIVHGGALGLDQLAEDVARTWGLDYEAHHAYRFPSPRARNQHMVDLGADVCLAFALGWASGTGMCARMARRAGIPVIDLGVDTAPR